MRELRLHAYCDPCLEAGTHEEVDPDRVLVLALREGEPRRQLDLCQHHEAQLLGPLRELLTGSVAPPPAMTVGLQLAPALIPAGSEDPAVCPVCSKRIELARNMMRHLEKQHGVDRPPQPAHCPDCDYESEEANRMKAHRNRTHGWRELDELLGRVHA